MTKSAILRQDQRLLRNEFTGDNKWGIPSLQKNDIDIKSVELMPFKNAKFNDQKNVDKTILFFIDDQDMDKIYHDYKKNLEKLAQYRHLLTPDYSLYPEMPLAIQLHNVFRNRWCGALWQSHRLSVIPSVSWSTEESFEFCFEGIPEQSTVAVSTVGVLTEKEVFLPGFYRMCELIKPTQILCYGRTFPEMDGENIICFDYNEVIRRKK